MAVQHTFKCGSCSRAGRRCGSRPAGRRGRNRHPHMVTCRPDPPLHFQDVSPAEDDGRGVIDGIRVGEQVELGGVYRHPARLEAVEHPVDEPHPLLDRPEVFDRAGRPAEVEVPQVRGDGVHVLEPEGHQPPELVRLAQAGLVEYLQVGGVFVGRPGPAVPARRPPRACRWPRSRSRSWRKGGEWLLADGEPEPAPPRPEHVPFGQGLGDEAPLPEFAVQVRVAAVGPEGQRACIRRSHPTNVSDVIWAWVHRHDFSRGVAASSPAGPGSVGPEAARGSSRTE